MLFRSSYYAPQCLLGARATTGEQASIPGACPCVGDKPWQRPVYCGPAVSWAQPLHGGPDGGSAWVSSCGGWHSPGVLGGCVLTPVQWNQSSFLLSSDLGVIFSFPVVGRNGFSRASLGLLENRWQEMLTSGGEGGLWALEEGRPASLSSTGGSVRSLPPPAPPQPPSACGFCLFHFIEMHNTYFVIFMHLAHNRATAIMTLGIGSPMLCIDCLGSPRSCPESWGRVQFT